MAITKLADLINPQVMGDMISAKIPAMIKYTPFAKVDTTLEGVAGDTKTVPSWNFSGEASDFDPEAGSDMAIDKLTATSTTFTIKCAGKVIGVYQTAINSGLGDPIGQAETQLAKAIAVKMDNDVLACALKGTQTYNGTSNVIKYAGIVDAIDVFGEEEITDKVMFVHPKQITTLRKDADFLSADKYQAGVMVSGEIGMIAGVRIVPSNKVPLVKATLATSSTSGAVQITSSNISTYQGYVWDATNRKMVAIAVDDYVKAVSNNYYQNPIIKLEPASAETEYTETELPALTIFMKKRAQLDHEWLPKAQRHDFTIAEYYGVALTNACKVVVASIKA